MTDAEKKEAIQQYVLSQMNNNFTDSEGNQDIPLDVQFAIEKLHEMELDDELKITSRKEGGISVTFAESIPPFVSQIIYNHRRMKW